MHSTFYAWSQEHIKRVFEAKSARDCLRALDDTFSQTIDLSLNGQSLPRTHLQTAIMAMVESSGFRLSVEWFSGSECARDMSNRNGTLEGYYVIRNIRKQLPGSPAPMLFERHKRVSVVIESESQNPTIDSRRIVKLAIVATDEPMRSSR
ncbi:hypothetical protein IEO21_06487 [Rhodonia placenta]|uniref:Uncharacterized protein n=2 Tax=Rhodonia placenta TaxID=104341 RepID=A0A1X6MMX8_9APHY|nr:hypothetical protein POSPLADRAFT_1061314 [Postia placenta MAD-698-R-SB12]KAF9811638.1 hypothetical protein IEO21_06487 [Postia placenta]OSX57629.1 hypothetical protein POSPLADRAFT_1061314 [Postia placenta MAD-698-R-SB12]